MTPWFHDGLEGPAFVRLRRTSPAVGSTPRARIFTAPTSTTRAAPRPAPQAPHLTADTVAADLVAIAETGGVQRFAFYGYSWLALTGL
jgi:hypothetical protein